MALEIVKIGHPILRHSADLLHPQKILHKDFQQFLDEMVATMHLAEGVGLAANQVGAPFSAFVMECQMESPRYPGRDDIPLAAYMNLMILEHSEEKVTDWEGCLSIPGYRGLVPRSQSVTFEALDRHGKKVQKTVEGFHARIIQHETDHLNGLFYMERMPDLKNWRHLESL